MSDPTEITTAVNDAEDAFNFANGRPEFEPTFSDSTDASDGEITIQKACRLLQASEVLADNGDYYGAIMEQAFIAIEHTLQGYLFAFTGAKETDVMDHDSPYELSKDQVPLENSTLETLKNLQNQRRNEHYYSTSITTRGQAESMNTLATNVHEYIVGEDHSLTEYCNCDD